jgi:hypothetical protein
MRNDSTGDYEPQREHILRGMYKLVVVTVVRDLLEPNTTEGLLTPPVHVESACSYQ